MNSHKTIAVFLRSVAARDLETPADRLNSLQEIGLQLCDAVDANLLPDPTFAKVREWCRWARRRKPYERPYAICVWHVVETLISQRAELTPPPEDQGRILNGNVSVAFVQDAADGIADILDPPRERWTKDSANRELMMLAVEDPTITKNPSLRKYADMIGCSVNTVRKTAFWGRLQRDKVTQKKPLAVSLTANTEAMAVSDRDAELQRLVDEQRAENRLDQTHCKRRERKEV